MAAHSAAHDDMLIDYPHDYRRAVFLSATPRSGSTWVANLLRQSGARLMFEPFQSEFVPAAAPFPYALYLRPGGAYPAQLSYARSVLEGRVRHPWIDRRPQPRFARERLIKEVRAHMWLCWLQSAFPGLPIVVLLRHPCAAADSLTALGWPSRLEGFFAQSELVEDHLQPLLPTIRSARSIFEEHVIVWCIQHHVALRQLRSASVLLTFYERFVLNGAAELRRVAIFLGRSRHALSRRSVSRRPIQDAAWTTRPDSLARHGTQPRLIEEWTKRVDSQQKRRALEIVAAFGLDSIYGDGTRPDVAAAEGLLSGATPARS